jgi:RimJ/RimL family protein N-acetyltransferase
MSTPDRTSVSDSPLEEDRFGIRAARAFVDNVNGIDEIEAFCTANDKQLLVVRCPASNIRVVQELENRGARLMDTLVYFDRGIAGAPLPERSGSIRVRRAVPSDEQIVGQVARLAFAGFFGHYHADERLDRAASDASYVDWARRSVGIPGVADAVFVAEDDGGMTGFSTVRLNTPEESEGILFAVHPRAQGRGVCREVMIEAMRWAAGNGAQCTVVPTQLTNLASQKVWLRLGFEPRRAVYTFHKWI